MSSEDQSTEGVSTGDPLTDTLIEKARAVVALRFGRTEYSLAGAIDELEATLRMMGAYE